MDDEPHQRSTEESCLDRRYRRLAALALFLGVWLISSGVTLFGMNHNHNPYAAFTVLPAPSVFMAIALYAALLAVCWMATPTFKIGFYNELVFVGLINMGGILTPGMLTMLVEALAVVL